MPATNDPKSLQTLNLAEASIKDLLHALDTRAITSVRLVSLYLHRIGYYDCRGPSLNSVCVLNPKAFEDTQQSDDYRASGHPPRPLGGIPFTVKDSFMVKDMTVVAGSPTFTDLLASNDAAIVSLLRKAGAVILGKTNMPAMADGRGQRGLYGRAESPYNPLYSTTAYASGSSNGCGTSTAASFAAFGFAGETVSSGRSPASKTQRRRWRICERENSKRGWTTMASTSSRFPPTVMSCMPMSTKTPNRCSMRCRMGSSTPMVVGPSSMLESPALLCLWVILRGKICLLV